GGDIWFTDQIGHYLGRYQLDAGSQQHDDYPVQKYELPTSLTTLSGNPWQIRTDADDVYFNKLFDNELVRADKHELTNNPDCLHRNTDSVGDNPCFHQLYLPSQGPDEVAHSIDLKDDKLWFTINVTGDGVGNPYNKSRFGFVNVGDWKAGAPTGTL